MSGSPWRPDLMVICPGCLGMSQTVETDIVARIVREVEDRVAEGTAIKISCDAYHLLDQAETWIDQRKRGAQADT